MNDQFDKVQLNSVFTDKWEGLRSEWSLGKWDEIYLMTDGNGFSGHYDRVHLKTHDGDHVIIPAHHCKEMELINPTY